MSNFWSRTITGLSMVFILLAALWFSGWVFAGIFFLITLFGMKEFYGLVSSGSLFPQKTMGIIAGAVIFAGSAVLFLLPEGKSFIPLPGREVLPFLLPLPFIFLVILTEIYRNKPNPLANIAITVLGFLYIALPLSLLTWFNRPGTDQFLGFPVIMTAYFGFTWINDTAAYLYGKQFGRHKFFERISPKKTWEGTIAGALSTLIFAWPCQYLAPGIPPADWYVLAILVILFGTHGDLAESLIKRSLNVKDSGTILPGHGGILDRFDTMLVSAPFVFLYFYFMTLIRSL